MGMPVRLVLYAAGRPDAERAARAAFRRVAALDEALSDYRPDSEVSRLSASAGAWTPVGVDLIRVLARALEIAEKSGGAFDPTAGPLTAIWREARRTKRAPDPAALQAARDLVGWRLVDLDRAGARARLARAGMRLDLGGIAKGYILQEGLAVLRAEGVPCALVEAGGDIVAGDAPPGRPGWHVDVPSGDAAFAARARALARAALATSGATAQFVEIDGVRYSHVIDPRTGLGVTDRRVTRVISPDAATADALATAVGVLGLADSRRLLAHFPDAIVSVTAADERPPLPQVAGSSF